MIRYVLATLALIVTAAAVTSYMCYKFCSDPQLSAAVKKGDALEWLRSDFGLNAAQFAAVKRLHESYGVVCEEHCRAIQEAARHREQVRAQSPANPITLGAAEKKFEELRTVCETAIAAHVRQVAAHMSPDQGARYLALVLPKIKDFDHQGAADLRIEHRH